MKTQAQQKALYCYDMGDARISSLLESKRSASYFFSGRRVTTV